MEVWGREVGQAKLKKQLAQRSWAISVNRVVILEWLDPDEPQTGTGLAKALKQQDPNTPVDVVKCRGREEVIKAIQTLTSEVSTIGKPILHIEAHGYVPGGEVALGFAGPSPGGGKEVLRWEDLVPHIRALNVATGFNLIVVAAACLSDSLLLAAELDKALPFLLLLGFSVEVFSDVLQASLLKFYSALLHNNLTLAQAYDLAESVKAEGAGLAIFSLLQIIVNAVQIVVRQDQDGHFDEGGYMRVVGETALVRGAKPLTPQEFIEMRRERTEAAVQVVLGRLLALDLLPGNQDRFGLQTRRLINDVRRR